MVNNLTNMTILNYKPKSFSFNKRFLYSLIIYCHSICVQNCTFIIFFISIFFKKHLVLLNNNIIIAPTVHTTLPIRTASQGVSFAFIALPIQVSKLVNSRYSAHFSFIINSFGLGGLFLFVYSSFY